MCILIKAQWEGHCPNFIFHTVSHSMYSSQGTFSQLRLFPEMFSNQKNSPCSKTFHSHFLSFISQSSVDSTYVSSIDWAKNNRINDVVSLWVHYGFSSPLLLLTFQTWESFICNFSLKGRGRGPPLFTLLLTVSKVYWNCVHAIGDHITVGRTFPCIFYLCMLPHLKTPDRCALQSLLSQK